MSNEELCYLNAEEAIKRFRTPGTSVNHYHWKAFGLFRQIFFVRYEDLILAIDGDLN